jgi:hypothetical protein
MWAMMLPLETIVANNFDPWPCTKSNMTDIAYYMTAPNYPGKQPEKVGMVKLGVKVIHVTGQIYGNIIEIPLDELKRLITQVEYGQ